MTRIRSFAGLTRWTFAAAAMLLFAIPGVASAQQSFATPDEAVAALVEAAKTNNKNALLAILGPEGEDIVSSGDDVQDTAQRGDFVAFYEAKHDIKVEGDTATLIIGQDDFPFPIPLVRENDKWQFDAVAGAEEVIYRRVGRNELNAVEACRAYVDAQTDYADKDRTGAGPGVYAQRIASSPGKKDGLYWPTAEGEEDSPLGEMVAQATRSGYRFAGGRTPFHGYYYKILTKQGPVAPGGALDYVVQGRMIGGFALVAYPAEYAVSGVMTFIVNHAGTVYEKDLGPNTAQLAEEMTTFNPDRTWKKVTLPEQASGPK